MATNETPKAALAFEAYCDLGPDRSLRALEDKTGTKLSQLGVWSRTYNWVARAAAFDKDQAEKERRKREREEEQKRRKLAAERDAMNQRHALIGTTQQKTALDQIAALIKAKKFGSQATVQLLKLATDLERLARGEATERTEQQQSGAIQIQVMYVNDWRQNSLDDPAPDAPSGAEDSTQPGQAIQLAQRRKKMA